MTQYFFDTSAFAKRYHVEAGSDRVGLIFRGGPNSRYRISRLTVMETQSAFATKVRTGHITPNMAISLLDLMLQDVSDGIVELIELERVHFSSAADLVWKYGFERRMRTLDAIQLAVALDLRSKGLLDIFVVADKILAEMAMLEGLPVLNPEVAS